MAEADKDRLKAFVRRVIAVIPGQPTGGYLRFDVAGRSGGRTAWKMGAESVSFGELDATTDAAFDRLEMLFSDGHKVVKVRAFRTGKAAPFESLSLEAPVTADDDDDDDGDENDASVAAILGRVALRTQQANERLLDRLGDAQERFTHVAVSSARLLGQIEGTAGDGGESEAMAAAMNAALPLIDRYGDVLLGWLFGATARGGAGTARPASPPPPPSDPDAAAAAGAAAVERDTLLLELEQRVGRLLALFTKHPYLATPEVQARIRDIMSGKVQG